MRPRYALLLPQRPECRKCPCLHEGKGKKDVWGIQCGATGIIKHSKSYAAMEEELQRQCPIIRLGVNDRIEGIV